MTTPVLTPNAGITELTQTTNLKIYPSSAAFMIGNQVATTKNSSCFRYLWAVQHSGASKEETKPSIPAESAALGALDEFRYSAILDSKKVNYEREKPFKIEYKGAFISGRMDFDREDGVIVEKKATTSDYALKDAIQGGEPDPNHVAQLVSYLAFLKRSEGHLVTSFYEMTEERNGYEVLAERTWVFKLSPEGDLTVDSSVYRHSVKDLARWYAGAHTSLTDPWTLPPKPIIPALAFKSPCYSCPLKAVCEQNDQSGMEPALYLESAKQAFRDKAPARKFKINWNSKRRKENRLKKEKDSAP